MILKAFKLDHAKILVNLCVLSYKEVDDLLRSWTLQLVTFSPFVLLHLYLGEQKDFWLFEIIVVVALKVLMWSVVADAVQQNSFSETKERRKWSKSHFSKMFAYPRFRTTCFEILPFSFAILFVLIVGF